MAPEAAPTAPGGLPSGWPGGEGPEEAQTDAGQGGQATRLHLSQPGSGTRQ